MKKPKYQLFGRLTDEQLEGLRNDIKENGVRVAVEVDKDGNILDGHHRAQIAEELGIDYEEIEQPFTTEAEKRQHVIMVNMMRRHLAPHEWGGVFKRLLVEKGVPDGGRPGRGAGGSGGGSASLKISEATIGSVAQSLGVNVGTAWSRRKLHDTYEKLPKKSREAVDAGVMTIAKAVRNNGKGNTATQTRHANKARQLAKCDEITKLLGVPAMRLDVVTIRQKVAELRKLLA